MSKRPRNGGLGRGSIQKIAITNNLAATSAPTVNDDTSKGYDIGSLWMDTTNDKVYMAEDITDGNANWVEIGPYASTEDLSKSDGNFIVGSGSVWVAESGATLRTSVGVGTGDSPQFTGIELGHASDTTLVRASSGDVNIEGNRIYRAGGTDVAVADGGTGASSLTNLITLATHTTGDFVATVTAGTGLTSTGGTSGEDIDHSLSVDASQTQITAVGTIATGVWEGTTVAVAQGGTGATSLSNLITLATHTTGDYVQNITAGTGLTSSGGTSGENIAHSLSVDASQTQITSVGTIGTGVWEGTTVAVDQGGTGATSLSNLITMGTHTTGDFVGTITAGTGLTSNAGTTGEDTDHSLSVDASQTQITAVGTIATGVWEGTDVGVAHGGTGASSATAGFDALSPMTAEGDVLYGGSSGTVTKLAKGTDTHVLTLASGVPSWAAPTVGDITSVVAGTGLTGSSLTSGDATLNVIGGDGITANANDMAITAAQTTITSIYNAGLIMGGDAETAIDFGTSNEIDFKADNAARLTLTSSSLYSVTNAQIDLGTTALGFNDLHLATGGVLNWANGEMTITEGDANTLTVAGGTFATAAMTGTTIDATTDFTIGSTIITDGVITDSSGLSVVAATTITGSLTIGEDDTGHDVKFFGAAAGAYMEWDESENQLRLIGASADAAGSSGKLLLATAQTDVRANDILGQIDFQAPLETGTDAIVVSASVKAMAQGTFAANVNATDLIFYTAHDAAVAERFRFTSQGEIGIGGANYGTDGQVLTSGGAGAAPAWEDVDAATTVTYTSASANEPVVSITNTHADATAGILKFVKDPGAGQGADDDVLGTISFYGTDAGNNAIEELARIQSYIVEADHGSEAGGMKFYVAENDATMTAGLQILGVKDADGEIDVTIGAGAAATTIIAGTLTMGSTATLTNAGLVAVADQSNITGVSALAGGSIAAGFGAIDNGTSGIRTNTFTAETSIVPDAASGATLGTADLEWGHLYIGDDQKVYLGDGQDVSLEYDEDGTDQLRIAGNTIFEDQVESTLDIMFDSTPADETVSGITATFTAGEDLLRGEVVYFKAGDSKMWKAVASAAATARCVAMAAADISADAAGLFLLRGFLADNGTFPSYTIAGVIYTPEAETSSQNVPEQAAPDTAGDFVQVLGWAVTANSVYFDPDSTVIEVG
jgi:hypothetical protein